MLFISLSALVGFSGFTQKSSNGISCERQVEICLKRLDNLQEVLNRVASQCANSGSEGCKNAVATLEQMVAEASNDCSEKIDVCI